MEQTIVFGPIICFGGGFCIIIIAFLGLVIYLIARGKAQSWTGTVTNKIYNEKDKEGYTNRKEHFYSLEIKLDDGKIVHIAVDSQRYNDIKTGDRLKKEKGQNWPEKIEGEK